jgi:hypothetical protein
MSSWTIATLPENLVCAARQCSEGSTLSKIRNFIKTCKYNIVMNPQWFFLLDKARRKRKTQQGDIFMPSGKSTIEVIATSCWQEYQMLNSLMLRLMEAASQVQIYAVVLLGGLVPLIQYIESVSSSLSKVILRSEASGDKVRSSEAER